MLKKLPIEGNFSKEAEFQQVFGQVYGVNPNFYYKLTDASRGYKPFDCIVVDENGSHFCELKIIQSNTLDLDKIRGNQFSSLKKIVNKGGLAYIIVWSKKNRNYKIIPFQQIIPLMNQRYIKIF